jgi:putative ABC transport system permease protein
MAWLLVGLRRLRDERAPAIGLALLILATALVFALGPRILGRVADEALRGAVEDAPAAQANLQLIQARRIGQDARGPLEGARIVGEELEAQLPAGIRGLVDERSFLAETPRYRIEEPTPTESYAILRFQPGLTDRLALTSGRWPAGTTATMPDFEAEPGATPRDLPVLEIAVSDATAEAYRIAVGDTLRLSLDMSDPLTVRRAGNRIAAAVVGTYRVPDPGSSFWLGEPVLERPVIRAISSEIQFLDATVVASPDAYDAYMAATAATPAGALEPADLRYTWRFYVDPGRLEGEEAAALVADLRRLEAVFPTSAAAAGPGGTILRSGLLRIVAAEQAAWRSAEAILAVAIVGPAAVTLGALGLVAVLVAQRRRAAVALWRSRGASLAQVAGSAIAEGILVALPAVVAATWLATLAEPDGELGPTALAAAAVAAVATALVTWAVVGAARASDRAARTDRDGGVARRTNPRRTVLELLVVGLALGGALLLRDRGVRAVGDGGPIGPADPFVAAVPLLLGLAAALIAIRLYPVVTRLAAAVAATGRDLVAVHALRQASRGVGGGAILLVLLVTAAVAAFGSTTLVHLDRAMDAVAWQETGASFRVVRDPGPLPSGFDSAAIEGVEATAEGHRARVSLGYRVVAAELLALDTAAYARVTAGTPVEPAFPLDLASPGAEVPAIIGTLAATSGDELALGDTFEVTVGGERVTFRVAEIRPSFPTLPLDEAFIVVDLARLASAVGPDAADALRPTDAFLRAPTDAADGIEAALAVDPGLVLAGRDARAGELRASPIVSSVVAGVTAAAIVAATYAILAIGAALALVGAARAPEVAMLRTLGLAGRQVSRLVAVEYGPLVLVALGVGALLGLVTFVILLPGLGFASVVGSPVDVPLALVPGQLVVLAIALAVILVLAIGMAAALERASDPVAVLRRGTE